MPDKNGSQVSFSPTEAVAASQQAYNAYSSDSRSIFAAKITARKYSPRTL